MVVRVIHFLARTAGIDAVDFGGRCFLSGGYRDALTGSVAEAARRLCGMDELKPTFDDLSIRPHWTGGSSGPQRELGMNCPGPGACRRRQASKGPAHP